MNKFIALLLGCCTMFFLTGCPKPGPGPAPTSVCGGFPGTACPGEQYCRYEIGADCGRADATGICTPKPEVCTQDYTPVCGCDGKTYGNACMAASAGVSVVSEGQCGGKVCAGIGNILCPDGQVCVDVPDDGCDPSTGGADCSGICEDM